MNLPIVINHFLIAGACYLLVWKSLLSSRKKVSVILVGIIFALLYSLLIGPAKCILKQPVASIFLIILSSLILRVGLLSDYKNGLGDFIASIFGKYNAKVEIRIMAGFTITILISIFSSFLTSIIGVIFIKGINTSLISCLNIPIQAILLLIACKSKLIKFYFDYLGREFSNIISAAFWVGSSLLYMFAGDLISTGADSSILTHEGTKNFIFFIFIATILVVIISSGLRVYKRHMADIKVVFDEKESLARELHRRNKDRQSYQELARKQNALSAFRSETGEDLALISQACRLVEVEIAHEVSREAERLMQEVNFDSTCSALFDQKLQDIRRECLKQDILFQVFVNSEPEYPVKRWKITRLDLQRVVMDLLENAFHALEQGGAEGRRLDLYMGLTADDIYEIDIYDNGIPFPASVLARIGEPGNTTWGTGIGLPDTISTLFAVQASLSVTQIDGRDTCVSVLFNGKGEVLVNGTPVKAPTEGVRAR